jgi:hypothetical protein
MTVKKKTPGATKNGAASNGKKEKEVKKVTLTAVQLDKFTAIQQKELAFQNELVAVRVQKRDLLEVILDAHGYTQEELVKIKNIILNDKNELEVTG